MFEQNAPFKLARKSLSDSTTWSTIALFLILICFFIWLTANSAADPRAGASVIESLKSRFGPVADGATSGTAQLQSDKLGAATDMLLAAGAQKAGMRRDVPGDVRVTFLGKPMFEEGSSALTAEGSAAVRALSTALVEGGNALRADVLLPPQGDILTALDSVRVAVMASTLEAAGAPMDRLRLGLAADKADGLVVGLGLYGDTPGRPS